MSALMDATSRMKGGVQRYLDAPDHGAWDPRKSADEHTAAGAANAARDAWIIRTKDGPVPTWLWKRTQRAALDWLADGTTPAQAIRAALALPQVALAHDAAYRRAHSMGRGPDRETQGTATLQGASLLAQGCRWTR